MSEEARNVTNKKSGALLFFCSNMINHFMPAYMKD